MRSTIRVYFTLILIALLSTFVLWTPFILQVDRWFGLDMSETSLLTIYQHYDGPLYLVPAKTLYDPQAIEALPLETSLPTGYYAAHLPLYPLLIRAVAPVFGYLKSMLLINLAATAMLTVFFYHFLTHFKLSKHPFLLTVVMLFLPRFFVVRSVGAPESLFMLLILVSLYYFEKKQFWLAGLAGGLSVMTKTPGVLLGVAYALVFLERMIRNKEFSWRWSGISLIGVGLLAVFALYGVQYGNFFAYFHSGDNIHLIAPFAAFHFQQVWVGTAWLEDILFYYFLYGLAIYTLFFSKHRSFFYFGLVFFVAILCIEHRDVARYSLPLWPLAVIALEPFFTSKRFWVIFLILLPGIFMYAWNFLLYNILPIANWAAYL